MADHQLRQGMTRLSNASDERPPRSARMPEDGRMAEAHDTEIALSPQDLREVTAFAAACADGVLALFEADRPDDARPREALAAAWEFARGGKRGKALRDTAWAASQAAGSAGTEAAREAARAAMSAAGAAYLHPLAKATQVKHILGSGAHAARAAELAAGGDPDVGAEHIDRAVRRATPAVVDVLRRYPAAPPGGGRTGELLRMLDAGLRALPLAADVRSPDPARPAPPGTPPA
ncbi:hypothetical protein GCM10010512_18970 [Streptomyces thermoviolaceus subsp. thermoviolaceus]|nr:hypothetical protein GCM10010512_18970 [Streptomyces thermoviolaceus subsp. thermoviolaceus]